MEQQSVRDKARIRLMRRCIETLDKTMFKENEVYLKIWLDLVNICILTATFQSRVLSIQMDWSIFLTGLSFFTSTTWMH